MQNFTRDKLDEYQRQRTAIPRVGDWVRLAVENISGYKDKTQYVRFSGKVIALPSGGEGYPFGSFSVWVEGTMVPARVIEMRYVHSINGERVHWPNVFTIGENKMRAVRETFNVTGSKGDTYTVEHFGNSWTCNCKGYGFRHQCSHIMRAQVQPAVAKAAQMPALVG